MADVIERLRGLVEKAKQTGDYTTLDKALDRSLPALLAVAEAAKRVDADLCFTAPEGAAGKMDHWHDDLSTALANLENAP